MSLNRSMHPLYDPVKLNCLVDHMQPFLRCHNLRYFQVLILGICACGIAVYINESLIFTVHTYGPSLVCAANNDFIETIDWMTRIDIFLNRILPHGSTITIFILCVVKIIQNHISPPSSASLPATVRGKDNISIVTNTAVQSDLLRIALILLLLVPCMTFPASGVKLVYTIKSIQNPGVPFVKLRLLELVLEFVSNCRSAANLIFIMLVSVLLRQQLVNCVKHIGQIQWNMCKRICSGSGPGKSNEIAQESQPEVV